MSYRFFGPAHTFCLDCVLRVTKARGIPEPDSEAVKFDFGLNFVSRCPGHIRYDGTFISDQGIQQGRLARVGPTTYHDLNSVSDQGAETIRFEQTGK